MFCLRVLPDTERSSAKRDRARAAHRLHTRADTVDERCLGSRCLPVRGLAAGIRVAHVRDELLLRRDGPRAGPKTTEKSF